MNPFSRRETYSSEQHITYRTLTVFSWLLSIIASLYYSIREVPEGHDTRKIWDINELHHDTAFYMNSIIASVYWSVKRRAAAREMYVY